MNMIERNKENGEKCLKALAELDSEKFFNFFEPDGIIETIGTIAASGRKPIAQVAKELAAMRVNFPNKMDLRIETTTGEGSRVICEVRGYNKTVRGEPYNNRYAFIMEFNSEGKIHEMREYQDTALVEKVLMESYHSLGTYDK